MSLNKKIIVGILTTFLLIFPLNTFAFPVLAVPSLAGIRLEFIIFALTLFGVALFHHKTMYVALTGLAVLLISKFIFDGDFSLVNHLFGEHKEWRVLINLFGLLLGFAILAKYFEESGVPEWLPKILPDDWKGGLLLLVLIFIMSAFLDNIAAAMIGGTIAMHVFNGRVHMGYLAAIIAASNAGGAGSVVGDTTTTLMWIDGVSAFDVTHAWVGSIGAFLVFGIFGSLQQAKYQPIQKGVGRNNKIDYTKIGIVVLILIGAVLTNVFLDFPAVGVWAAIIIGHFISKAPWQEIKHSLQGSIFLMSLVMAASLMPVDQLPDASWGTTFTLGFVSAVFDNIPLTKLCLVQGGYDWGILAYAVGFGGSMLWFGSSAGVALSNMYPEAKSVVKYVKSGWHVTVAYIVGFFIMLAIAGWNPHTPHKNSDENPIEHVEQHPVSKIIG